MTIFHNGKRSLELRVQQTMIRMQTRPNADDGWWLSCLIPIAYLINICLQKTDFDYKISTIISVGLFLQTLTIYDQLNAGGNWTYLIFTRILPGGFTAILVLLCLKQGLTFCILTGFVTTALYDYFFYFTLRKLPKSFTIGEATIVIQGLIVFLLNIYLKFIDYDPNRMLSDMQQMTILVQIYLFSVLIFISLIYLVPIFRHSVLFYLLAGMKFGCVAIFPIGDNIALTTLLKFLFNDMRAIAILAVYVGLVFLTVSFVYWHVQKNGTSTTRIRKMFHILIVIVFLIGFHYHCILLHVCCGALLGLMITLEAARIVKLTGVHELLERSIGSFIDEKDCGIVALTPIYLLVGCSLPIWLHSSPCSNSETSELQLIPLLAGVLSVGVGDTGASIVGSMKGSFKWPNGLKSIEGTIASIFLQGLFIQFLLYYGLVNLSLTRLIIISVAIVTNAVVEANTDQVDNLVLPLITFIILSFYL